jgi:hypothetical protein
LWLQGRITSGSIPSVDNISNGKVLSHQNQLKVTLPAGNGLSGFGSSAYVQAGAKIRPKIHVGRALNDVIGSPDALGEQNRGPRINRSKDQLAVKAYTTRAGDSNTQGNIIIYTDKYNKDEFPVDYVDAKFFVIKSYSEDDVHKSIKYNVWSSTPHGNKKLDSAYEDTQRIAAEKLRSCPIFLFFSVSSIVLQVGFLLTAILTLKFSISVNHLSQEFSSCFDGPYLILFLFFWYRSMLVVNSVVLQRWLAQLTSIRIWISGSKINGVEASLLSGTSSKMSQTPILDTLS